MKRLLNIFTGNLYINEEELWKFIIGCARYANHSPGVCDEDEVENGQ